jgi:hypothetical protein
MNDPIVLGIVTLLVMVPTALFAGGFAGYRICRRRMLARIVWPSYTQVIAPSAELEAHAQTIEAQAQVIAILTTVQVAPASDWSILPFQVVPSRAEITARTVLADELMLAWDRISALEVEADYWYGLKTKHWNALKRLRGRVRGMVPAEIAEFKADGFTRSLTVAKSAFGRAAELSTALSEIEVARFEATDLGTFNEAVESIYANHSLPITEPIGVLTA